MPSMSQEQMRSSLAEMGEIYRLRDQAEKKVAQNQRLFWDDVTPPSIQPAVKHIRDVFRERTQYNNIVVSIQVFLSLHVNTEAATRRLDTERLTGETRAKMMKLCTGEKVPEPIVFDTGLRRIRDVAKHELRTAFHMLYALAQNQWQFISTCILAIAERWNQTPVFPQRTGGLQRHLKGNITEVEWAKYHVELMVTDLCSGIKATTIKSMCDEPAEWLSTLNVGEDDLDDQWLSPTFLHMSPLGNMPYRYTKAWERLSKEDTDKVLSYISNTLAMDCAHELQRVAGDLIVKAMTTTAQTTASSFKELEQKVSATPRPTTVIADIIKKWRPAALPSELQYRDSLATFVRRQLTTARVETEYRHLGTTIDIYVKETDTETFIELKRNLLRKTEFDRLVGQIESLQPAQHSVIIVLCGETKASFIGRLKERYPSIGFDVLVIASEPIAGQSKTGAAPPRWPKKLGEYSAISSDRIPP
jgi:hypothetical protein